LTSVGVSAAEPKAGRPLPRLRYAPDAVGAQPAVGPAHVPASRKRVVQAGRLAQGTYRCFLTMFGQHHRQVFQGGRQ
jgi:hypothetical protein